MTDQARGNTPPSRSNKRDNSAEALRDCHRALELERQRFDQFVSLVSHELRGPLSTLIGYAQMIARDGRQPAPLREKAAHSILDQARRMNAMIENMLQASRLAIGRLRFERQATDLLLLVQQVVAQQQAAAPNHRLILDSPTNPIVGDWDPQLLSLALSNLISNAVKFSPSGGDVSIRVRVDADCAVVAVEDRGIGIAPEDVSHLFEPYRRAARTAHFPGIGVGLFVAKGIVEALGGRVAVQTSPDRGSVFSISLPFHL